MARRRRGGWGAEPPTRETLNRVLKKFENYYSKLLFEKKMIRKKEKKYNGPPQARGLGGRAPHKRITTSII